MQKKYTLYWEDVGERLIYAQLDDFSWKLAEKILKYKKHSSIYIYHDGKLAAFYSTRDSKKESQLGYNFYKKVENRQKIMRLKKSILKKVEKYDKLFKKINLKKINDNQLKKLVLDSLDLYHEALSVHYLTQPQFFEEFSETKNLKKLAEYRLKYTRFAWTKAMSLSRIFLREYAKRKGITLTQAESLKYSKLKNEKINKGQLKPLEKAFVLVSTNHKIKILSGNFVKDYIRQYEEKLDSTFLKGVIGHRGVVKGKAFVIKNENLDLKNLPKGMKKGMILIIQNAWPELSIYYKKASAIVTNEGGITSHGVVVSRELGIPCIVGTKIATKIFKTGDFLEVDANKGIVKKILTHSPRSPKLFK